MKRLSIRKWHTEVRILRCWNWLKDILPLKQGKDITVWQKKEEFGSRWIDLVKPSGAKIWLIKLQQYT